MKKRKILAPLVGVATVAVALTPLTSCAIKGEEKHVKSVDKMTGTMSNSLLINITLDQHYAASDLKLEIVGDEAITSVLYTTHVCNGNVVSVTLRSLATQDDVFEFGIKITCTKGWTETISGFKFTYGAPQMFVYLDNQDLHELDSKDQEHPYEITVTSKLPGQKETPISATVVSSDESIVKVENGFAYIKKAGSCKLIASYPGYTSVEYEIVIYPKGEIDPPKPVVDPKTGETHYIVEVSDEAKKEGKDTGEFNVPEKLYVDGEWVNVTEVGDFSGTHYEKVIIPSTIEKIVGTTDEQGQPVPGAPGAFENCEDLTTLEFEGESSNLNDIPADTFKNSGLESADLSKCGELNEIKESTFENCEDLTTVKLPSSVTTLGSRAFAAEEDTEEPGTYKGSLQSIEMPGVQTLGEEVFENQKQLESITIPKTVQDTTDPETGETVPGIGEDAFTGCDKLTEITIEVDPSKPESRYTLDLVEGGVKTTDPSKETSTSLFGDNQGASEYEDPSTGPRAQYIYVPAGTELNADSFIAMNYEKIEPSLKEGYDLYVPKYNKTMSFSAQLNIDIDHTEGYELKALYESITGKDPVELDVPADADHFAVTSGENYIELEFRNGLVFVKPKAGLTSIGTAQIQVKYPEYRYAVGTIDVEIASYDKVTIDTNGIVSKKDGASKGEIYIPAKYHNGNAWVNVVGFKDTGAFEDCTELTKIHIPSSVTTLGSTSTFKGCSALTDVDFVSSSDATSITTIGAEAFMNCKSLKNITGLQATTIGDDAFNIASDTGSLETFDMTKLTSIGARAFKNQALKNVTIPSTITGTGTSIIGQNAFTGCASMESVTVESSYAANLDASVESSDISTDLYTIAPKVSVLTSLVSGMPSTSFIKTYFLNPTEVGSYTNYTATTEMVLTDCTQNFDIHNTAGYVFAATCKGRPVTISLSYPTDLLEEKQEANGDKKLVPKGTAGSGNIVVTSGSLTSITIPFEIADYDYFDFAVSGNNAKINAKTAKKTTSLTSIVVPNNYYDTDRSAKAVNEIADNGFEDCVNLINVKLTTAIKKIPSAAFKGCTSLTTINDGSATECLSEVTAIGDNAFENCSALTTFKLGSKVATIGDGAFKNSGLSSFDYLDGETSKTVLTSIGASAFEGCTGLEQFKVLSGTVADKTAFNGCTGLKTVYIDNLSTATATEHSLFTAAAKTHIYINTSITITSYTSSYVYKTCIVDEAGSSSSYKLYKATASISISTESSYTKLYNVVSDTSTAWSAAKYSASGLKVVITDIDGGQTTVDPVNDSTWKSQFTVQLQRKSKDGGDWEDASPSGTGTTAGYFTRADADDYYWSIYVKYHTHETRTDNLEFEVLKSIDVTDPTKVTFEDGDTFLTTGIAISGNFTKDGSSISSTKTIGSEHKVTYGIKYDGEASFTTITPGTSTVKNATDAAIDATIQVSVAEGSETFTDTYNITVNPFKYNALSIATTGTYWSNVWVGSHILPADDNLVITATKTAGGTETVSTTDTSLQFSLDNTNWKTLSEIQALWFDSTASGSLYVRYKKTSGTSYITAPTPITYTPQSGYGSISMTSTPTTMTYYYGDTFNPSGLKITPTTWNSTSHTWVAGSALTYSTRAKWETAGFSFYQGSTVIPSTFAESTYSGALTVKLTGKSASTLSCSGGTLKVSNPITKVEWVGGTPTAKWVYASGTNVKMDTWGDDYLPAISTLGLPNLQWTKYDSTTGTVSVTAWPSTHLVKIGGDSYIRCSYSGVEAPDVDLNPWWTTNTAECNATFSNGSNGTLSVTKDESIANTYKTIFASFSITSETAARSKIFIGNQFVEGGTTAGPGVSAVTNSAFYVRYTTDGGSTWINLGAQSVNLEHLFGVKTQAWIAMPSAITGLTSGTCQIIAQVKFTWPSSSTWTYDKPVIGFYE